VQSERHNSHRLWFWAIFTSFLLQGIQYSTWISRTPEIQQALHLDTVAMGGFTLAMAMGSLVGMLLGGQIIHRIGARNTMLLSYALSSTMLGLFGVVVATGVVGPATLVFVLLGVMSGSGGLAVNVEGANVDRASTRSLLPSLHGAFSVGTLAGGAAGTFAIILSITLQQQFIALGAVLFAANLVVWRLLPRDDVLTTQNIAVVQAAPPSRAERALVWREPRTVQVALIVFGFNLAEGAASTWLPISMVDVGLSEAAAAGTYTVFAAAMAVTRLSGGFVVDKLGRSRSLLVFAAICATGIMIVMATPLIAMPFLGAALWGVGNSLGFPLCVSAISDDPRLSSSRVSVLALSSNAAGLAGPPLIGGLGQLCGLLVAFVIPVGGLVGGMTVNRATREIAPLNARR
jgi:MFS family permease